MRKKMWLPLLLICLIISGCGVNNNEVSAQSYVDDTHFMFARSNLNKEEKQDYNRILNSLMALKKETMIHAEDEKDILKIYDSVLHDHPEIFWVSEFQYRETGSDDEGLMIIYPKYDYTKAEIKEYNKQLEIISDQIIKGIDPAASDYEKVKFIFDFVVNQTEYMDTAPDSQNIISSLINKSSVCAGYAKAVQYLLGKLDIDCGLITGRVKENNVNHAWNIVKMDNQYYYLDATFADNEDSQMVPLYRYLYFGMNSNDINNLYYDISEAVETKAIDDAFYMVNGNFMHSYNEAKLNELIDQSIESDVRNLYLRFDSSETMGAVNDHLIEDYQLFKLLEEKGIVLKNINYYQVPELNSTIYFW